MILILFNFFLFNFFLFEKFIKKIYYLLEELYDYFSKYGEIEEHSVILDKEKKISRGKKIFF